MPVSDSSTWRRIPAEIWVLGFVSLLMDIASEMVHSLLPVFLVSVIGTSVWVAVVPGFLAAALLVLGVREPASSGTAKRTNPITKQNLKRLHAPYWWVVGIGAVFTLARFSEAFLVLRAQQGGLALAYAPLVLVAMNVVYAAFAYPLGKLSDSASHTKLLAWSLVILIAADAMLAWSNDWAWVWGGISLWGLHMAMSQGLLASMVAGAVPSELRGTAYGFFNLASGAAMLLASVIAGLLWDQFGATFTFVVGGAFASMSLILILVYGRVRHAMRTA
ncbi:MAG: MFS transporter [Burkholderiales bacterium]